MKSANIDCKVNMYSNRLIVLNFSHLFHAQIDLNANRFRDGFSPIICIFITIIRIWKEIEVHDFHHADTINLSAFSSLSNLNFNFVLFA